MNRKQVLVVEDEVEVTSFFTYFLRAKGCSVTTASCGKEVRHLIETNQFAFDLALIDLKLPDANGLDLLQLIKADFPACEVMIMTGYSTIKSAVTAIQWGARDYLEKPFDDLDHLEKVIFSIWDKPDQQERDLSLEAAHYGIIYAPDSPMTKVMAVASKLAKKAINLLIEGETGTGKELMARFVHGASTRSQYPFVGVNCGAIPEALLESELFGHEKGAFTGAFKERRGFFELANNGTLFLDEVGEAPPPIQVKLLRVMETGEYMRVGGEQTCKSNIRFISATNRKLEQEVHNERFRADLLYRLEGVKLILPSLRERPNDIPAIVEYYMEKKYPGLCRVDPDAMELLKHYDWPGNIRQLLNVLNQTYAIYECKVIKAEHLPTQLVSKALAQPSLQQAVPLFHQVIEREAAQFVQSVTEQIPSVDEFDFEYVLTRMKQLETEVVRNIIAKGLQETKNNREKLSDKLKITKRTIRYILNEK